MTAESDRGEAAESKVLAESDRGEAAEVIIQTTTSSALLDYESATLAAATARLDAWYSVVKFPLAAYQKDSPGIQAYAIVYKAPGAWNCLYLRPYDSSLGKTTVFSDAQCDWSPRAWLFHNAIEAMQLFHAAETSRRTLYRVSADIEIVSYGRVWEGSGKRNPNGSREAHGHWVRESKIPVGESLTGEDSAEWSGDLRKDLLAQLVQSFQAEFGTSTARGKKIRDWSVAIMGKILAESGPFLESFYALGGALAVEANVYTKEPLEYPQKPGKAAYYAYARIRIAVGPRDARTRFEFEAQVDLGPDLNLCTH